MAYLTSNLKSLHAYDLKSPLSKFLIKAPFTPKYFNEELLGLADASGVSFEWLQQAHMLGKLNHKSAKLVDTPTIKMF
jgi:hypothetical protein